MASAMRVFRKFRASDGRIKIATLSGVSALVAVIAMLVGVLPVFAGEPGASSPEGVDPVQVDWGGGSEACDDDLNSLEDENRPARGPSSARYEAHLNNPRPGLNEVPADPDDPNETEITITVDDENDEFFTFSIKAESGMVAYDVVVNGGQKSNHYAYDPASNPVASDSHLHAPTKDKQEGEVHKLSHVNICYDLPSVTFVCGGAPEGAILFGEGIFAGATGQIFNNSNPNVGCVEDEKKQGLFFINNQAPEATTTLDFGDEGGVVAGRAVFTKDFEDPTSAESADPLKYDRDGTGTTFFEVQWCNVRDVADGDGDQFETELGTSLYPTLDATATDPAVEDTDDKLATACKVFEGLNADGIHHTVVYFEFEDPNFR